MRLDLKRICCNNFSPTFGVLCQEPMGVPFAVTLELPWRNNAKRKSCIPDGEYICKRVKSPKFGDTFQIMNVPKRSHILFHKGNRVRDLLGCVAVGEQFDHLNGELAILSSKHGYNEFMDLVSGVNEFELDITKHYK